MRIEFKTGGNLCDPLGAFRNNKGLHCNKDDKDDKPDNEALITRCTDNERAERPYHRTVKGFPLGKD